jgi:hypothetical protein
MDVIGHKNVATYRNVVLVSAATEQAKRFMDLRTREQLRTFVGIESDEVKRIHV